jgi:hypothetical protein
MLLVRSFQACLFPSIVWSYGVPTPQLVGATIATFIGNVSLTGDFSDDLAAQLEDLKRRSQAAEEDIPLPWRFAGEVLFMKPHGAGRQW